MTVEEMINRFEIKLSADHKKLKLYVAPDTSEEREMIKAAKQEIIEYIENEEKMMHQRIANRMNMAGLSDMKKCLSAINEDADQNQLEKLKQEYPQAAAFLEIEQKGIKGEGECAKVSNDFVKKFLNAPENWEAIYAEFKQAMEKFDN